MSVKQPTSTSHDIVGQLVLGRYRIVRPLARGGMGLVYLARIEGAAGFSRPVVVKRPHLTDDPQMAAMFIREARILSDLQHPGIVGVIDFGKQDAEYVMVLEYVHGYTLSQWHRYTLDSGRLMDVDHAIQIMVAVLEALQYAHTFTRPDGTARRIVHRDISPSNILIDINARVKLHDFGIARAEDNAEFQTHDGTFRGKLPYSAPELFTGESASPQTDVYSCGVVLYQLLTGANPFRAQDLGEVVHRVLSHVPDPPSTLRVGLSRALDAVVMRAIAKEPDVRFESATLLIEALHTVRKKAEQAVAAEIAACVREDFAAMPEALQVEGLDVRDAAWRAEQEDVSSGGRAALSSWPAPARSNEHADSATMRHGGPSSGTIALTGKTQRSTLPKAAVSASQEPVVAVRETKATSRLGMIVALSVSIVTAGVALVIAFFALRKPDEAAPRYLVVERTGASATPNAAEDQTAPAHSMAAPNTPASSAPTGSAERAVNATHRARTTPDPAAFSAALRRHQSKIEDCFARHAANIEGRPKISVRFQIAASGKVERVELIPSGLSGTTLGQCVLTVARSVKFGQQPEPVAFSIPIVARRVR